MEGQQTKIAYGNDLQHWEYHSVKYQCLDLKSHGKMWTYMGVCYICCYQAQSQFSKGDNNFTYGNTREHQHSFTTGFWTCSSGSYKGLQFTAKVFGLVLHPYFFSFVNWWGKGVKAKKGLSLQSFCFPLLLKPMVQWSPYLSGNWSFYSFICIEL